MDPSSVHAYIQNVPEIVKLMVSLRLLALNASKLSVSLVLSPVFIFVIFVYLVKDKSITREYYCELLSLFVVEKTALSLSFCISLSLSLSLPFSFTPFLSRYRSLDVDTREYIILQIQKFVIVLFRSLSVSLLTHYFAPSILVPASLSFSVSKD